MPIFLVICSVVHRICSNPSLPGKFWRPCSFQLVQNRNYTSRTTTTAAATRATATRATATRATATRATATQAAATRAIVSEPDPRGKSKSGSGR